VRAPSRRMCTQAQTWRSAAWRGTPRRCFGAPRRSARAAQARQQPDRRRPAVPPGAEMNAHARNSRHPRAATPPPLQLPAAVRANAKGARGAARRRARRSARCFLSRCPRHAPPAAAPRPSGPSPQPRTAAFGRPARGKRSMTRERGRRAAQWQVAARAAVHADDAPTPPPSRRRAPTSLPRRSHACMRQRACARRRGWLQRATDRQQTDGDKRKAPHSCAGPSRARLRPASAERSAAQTRPCRRSTQQWRRRERAQRSAPRSLRPCWRRAPPAA
jgi:hypothetical protein